MLTGAWRNFDHIEEELSLPELTAIVVAVRTVEHRKNKMAAALKGIDIDKDKDKTQDDPVEAAKRRVAMRRQGLNPHDPNSSKIIEAKESEKRLASIGFAVVKK